MMQAAVSTSSLSILTQRTSSESAISTLSAQVHLYFGSAALSNAVLFTAASFVFVISLLYFIVFCFLVCDVFVMGFKLCVIYILLESKLLCCVTKCHTVHTFTFCLSLLFSDFCQPSVL